MAFKLEKTQFKKSLDNFLLDVRSTLGASDNPFTYTVDRHYSGIESTFTAVPALVILDITDLLECYFKRVSDSFYNEYVCELSNTAFLYLLRRTNDIIRETLMIQKVCSPTDYSTHKITDDLLHITTDFLQYIGNFKEV